MVVADPTIKRKVRRALFFTGRLPESVEWIEAAAGVLIPNDYCSLSIRRPANDWSSSMETEWSSVITPEAAEWNNQRSALAGQ